MKTEQIPKNPLDEMTREARLIDKLIENTARINEKNKLLDQKNQEIDQKNREIEKLNSKRQKNNITVTD